MNLNASLSVGPVLVTIIVGTCKDSARVGEMDPTSVGIWDFPLTPRVVNYDYDYDI